MNYQQVGREGDCFFQPQLPVTLRDFTEMDISLDVLDIFKTVKNYVSNTTAKITEVKKSIFSIVRDS